jgi:hypothetical protein
MESRLAKTWQEEAFPTVPQIGLSLIFTRSVPGVYLLANCCVRFFQFENRLFLLEDLDSIPTE